MAGLTLEKEESEVKGRGGTGHSLAVLWTTVPWMVTQGDRAPGPEQLTCRHSSPASAGRRRQTRGPWERVGSQWTRPDSRAPRYLTTRRSHSPGTRQGAPYVCLLEAATIPPGKGSPLF